MSIGLRITLAEYDEMIRQGAFESLRNHRIELIRGELCEMTPPGSTHEDVIDRLANWSFRSTPEDEIRVRVQNSIDLPDQQSAPQPDIAWVKAGSYHDQRPQPSDVLLVIEVSDSSRVWDRSGKAELYAAAAIPDYWVVDIPHQCIEVRRDPRDGEYGSLQTIDRNGTVQPHAAPEIELVVDSLFGV